MFCTDLVGGVVPVHGDDVASRDAHDAGETQTLSDQDVIIVGGSDLRLGHCSASCKRNIKNEENLRL